MLLPFSIKYMITKNVKTRQQSAFVMKHADVFFHQLAADVSTNNDAFPAVADEKMVSDKEDRLRCRSMRIG